MNVRFTRVYADGRGESHFADQEVELRDAGPIGRLSAAIPARAVVFRKNDPGYDYDWHVAPSGSPSCSWTVPSRSRCPTASGGLSAAARSC